MADKPIHVEMYDGKLFCDAPNSYRDDYVGQEDWHESHVALNKATCTVCLDRIWKLGQTAGDRHCRVLRHIREAANGTPAK